MKMQGSITTPGSLALAHVQAQSQQPGGPKAPQPGQPSTLVTTTTTTTTTAKTTTITRPTPSSFKKDVPVSSEFSLIHAKLRSHQTRGEGDVSALFAALGVHLDELQLA